MSQQPDVKIIRKDGIKDKGVHFTVTSADNWLMVSLNGTLLHHEEGAPYGGHQENITHLLEDDKPNILSFALVNTYVPGYNPAGFDAVLNIGGEEISLSESTGGVSAIQGLMYHTTVVLTK